MYIKAKINLKVFNSADELYDFAANIFITEVKTNPQVILGLATGSTPIPLYEKMVNDYKLNKTDYSQVTTFNLDEYVGLSPEHHQSYNFFMNQVLFKHVNIKSNNIHIPLGIATNLQEECQRYHNLVLNNQIDIQLLGLGSNGHIAFNEPNTSFDSVTQIVELTEETRLANSRFFDNIKDVPTHAITMGLLDIMNAKTIILIALGKQKAQAVYDMLHGEVSEKVPASILQKHENVLILLDKEAARKLNDKIK